MTFLEALKTGRRRRAETHPRPWLHLGTEDASGLTFPNPRWREIETGRAIGLHRFDYEADDWQVMP